MTQLTKENIYMFCNPDVPEDIAMSAMNLVVKKLELQDKVYGHKEYDDEYLQILVQESIMHLNFSSESIIHTHIEQTLQKLDFEHDTITRCIALLTRTEKKYLKELYNELDGSCEKVIKCEELTERIHSSSRVFNYVNKLLKILGIIDYKPCHDEEGKRKGLTITILEADNFIKLVKGVEYNG